MKFLGGCPPINLNKIIADMKIISELDLDSVDCG
jgi:hypothetical protein